MTSLFVCHRNASQIPIDFLPFSAASTLRFLKLLSVAVDSGGGDLVQRPRIFSRGRRINGGGRQECVECDTLNVDCSTVYGYKIILTNVLGYWEDVLSSDDVIGRNPRWRMMTSSNRKLLF